MSCSGFFFNVSQSLCRKLKEASQLRFLLRKNESKSEDLTGPTQTL